jgi:hypothetical protein
MHLIGVSRVRSPLEQKTKFKGSCCLQYLLVENTWKFWSWMFFNESLFKEQKICDLVQVSCTLAANALCRLWRLSSWAWTCSRRRNSIIAFTSWTEMSFCLLTALHVISYLSTPHPNWLETKLPHLSISQKHVEGSGTGDISSFPLPLHRFIQTLLPFPLQWVNSEALESYCSQHDKTKFVTWQWMSGELIARQKVSREWIM